MEIQPNEVFDLPSGEGGKGVALVVARKKAQGGIELLANDGHLKIKAHDQLNLQDDTMGYGKNAYRHKPSAESARIFQQHQRFTRSTSFFARELARTACDKFFPTVRLHGASPMGLDFHVDIPDIPDKIIFVEIARGGSQPTGEGYTFFEETYGIQAPTLYICAQRKKNGEEKLTVDAIDKGTIDLTDSTLFIAEAAAASSSTILKSLTLVKERCQSEPKRVIVLAVNGALKHMNALAGKNIDIAVGILHGGVNDVFFLNDPGCGDVGARKTKVKD